MLHDPQYIIRSAAFVVNFSLFGIRKKSRDAKSTKYGGQEATFVLFSNQHILDRRIVTLNYPILIKPKFMSFAFDVSPISDILEFRVKIRSDSHALEYQLKVKFP